MLDNRVMIARQFGWRLDLGHSLVETVPQHGKPPIKTPKSRWGNVAEGTLLFPQLTIRDLRCLSANAGAFHTGTEGTMKRGIVSQIISPVSILRIQNDKGSLTRDPMLAVYMVRKPGSSSVPQWYALNG